MVSYNLALYEVERVAGTMLKVRGVEARRIRSGDLDHIAVIKGGVRKGAPAATGDNSENILVNPKAIRAAGPRTYGGSRAPP